jgi:hypothetical protein
MSKQTEFILKNLLIFLTFFIYWWLESGFLIQEGDEIIKSIIFTFSTYLAFSIKLKKLLLWLICFALILTVIMYSFWQMPQADFFGSIGFGMMLIYIISCLPEVIKKGYIEKL